MKTFNKKYSEIKLHHFALVIVLFGSLNSGISAIDLFQNQTTLIDIIATNLKKITDLPFKNIINITIAIAAIYLATDRDTWLPFLSETIFPHSFIPLKNISKYDTSINIKVPKKAKVAYWAANPHETTPFVMNAYGDYNNGGVVMADENGNAQLKIIKGSGYIVPSGRYIAPHIHYRVITNGSGMIGAVKKIYY